MTEIEFAIDNDDFEYFRNYCKYRGDVTFIDDSSYALLMFNLLKYEYQVTNRRQRDIGLESGFAVEIRRETDRTGYKDIARHFSYLCEAAENFKEHRESNYIMVLMLDRPKWYRKFFPNLYYEEHPEEKDNVLIVDGIILE